ncbi:VOC family protein [Streptomyces sp. SCSIO ZS0520]|uniref:VOC family protein n=1 Tax=Streptomyces sp. SCSIO ZS0520 TaxID=2892996 RepID=UPI0021DA46F9|nr:VOC family protein [Streptomyces sp. SCSIO ZS0520]
MPEIHEPFTPGTPCWVDLMAEDQRAAMDFYRELFGWTGEFGPPATGGYATLRKDGRAVCGIGARQAARGAEDPPHVWTTYLATEDADETLRRAREAGGVPFTEVFDIGDLGRMAMLADPTGAAFGIWQSREYRGAELVNEPGSLLWNNCETRDPAGAAEFYARVFALDSRPIPRIEGALGLFPPGAERPVGGIGDMAAYPPETPPFWLVAFSCADVDKFARAATGLGGEVLNPPAQTPFGRAAGVRDPWGGVFGVLANIGG